MVTKSCVEISGAGPTPHQAKRCSFTASCSGASKETRSPSVGPRSRRRPRAQSGPGVDEILKEVAMLLITGASGNAGSAVVKEVLKTNKPVKAMYRSPEDAAKASKDAGAVLADFADKPSLGRALEDVDAVYLV